MTRYAKILNSMIALSEVHEGLGTWFPQIVRLRAMNSMGCSTSVFEDHAERELRNMRHAEAAKIKSNPVIFHDVSPMKSEL